MSGDVQPRKRKDKKRKKDEFDEPPPQSIPSQTPPIISDDVNIHVHKDSSTGGGLCAKVNPAYAIKLFDKLLEKYPSSPRGLYGKAKALDNLAEQEKSNELLQKALTVYLEIINTKDVPDALFRMVSERCIDRMRFVGQYNRVILVHNKLILRFPDDRRYKNQLVVTYLIIGKINQARTILKDILKRWPDDGCALVHYGFILKTTDNDLKNALTFLQRGIDTNEPCTIDGRFYFHLGDTYSRLGQNSQAMKLYEDGVTKKVFLSKYQRSFYNIPRLTGMPWWDKEKIPYKDLYQQLENNWMHIRDEGLKVLNQKGFFVNESENLRDTGNWKQFELFSKGRKNVNNCRKCPITCKIIESLPEASGCRRGQTKFSVMHPGTHVWSHCGPTNCRLRMHLGLKVPPNTFIRVATDTRSWEEGTVIIFDDSFEHEVWQNATELRLVLIVDVWHPELTTFEKRTLSAI